MALSTESIIALIALLVTGPPSLLLAWNYFRRRFHLGVLASRSRGTSSEFGNSFFFSRDNLTSSSIGLVSDLVNLEPIPHHAVWRRREELEAFSEAELYTRRARIDLYLSQVSISVEHMC
ncbi:uncharacterized protein BJX67DRAFT_365902 [Aspergillus lucknowensis]|uniref:Uncharacterized protein n=1 Tax=Aspergillus lucknowensis TaxID=176173 RepID=A0ABR4LDL6_9EURO